MQKSTPQLNLFPAPDNVPEQVVFEIRKSNRARRLSVKVYPRGRVEVVVPRRATHNEVALFLAENRDWIERARRHFAADLAPDTSTFPSRIDLKAIGESYVVRWRSHKEGAPVQVRQLGSTLVLGGATEDVTKVRGALKRWLARVAREHYGPRLSELAAASGLKYGRLQVRAQKTCWGSHSSTGTISLNMCGLFLAPDLLRYLMLHELCHGRHMNHSSRFWALLESLQPGSRSLDRRLGESWREVPGWMGIY